MKTYQIASIPGDGIGKEVIPEGEKVLAAISKRFSEIAFHFERFDWGADFYRKTGTMMPDDGLGPMQARSMSNPLRATKHSHTVLLKERLAQISITK